MKDLREFIKTTIREFLNENHNSHLVEVIPNKYVYHTSNPIFRDKISKEGLIPKRKSENWLSDTNINGEVIFAVNSDDKEDWWDSTYDDDIYRIDTSKLKNRWYVDPNFDLEDKRVITFENIPLNSIKLIYKGSFSLDESINIENPSTDEYNIIVDDFLNHYYNGVGLNINNIPKQLINKLPFGIDDGDFYAGAERNRKIKEIQSWTLDSETAASFSKKYKNGKIFQLSYSDFKNQFKYFVSMDIIYDFINRAGLNNEKTDKYISESEIVILHNGDLKESVKIENPSSDKYNDIIVNGEKVGYIILSPARKEYYWVDVNLPNPLAIVDIKIFPQFRGKNYMKKTMNWLYNFTKDNGYKSLFLRVDDDSEVSQETLFKIYQKYGFKVYRTTDDEDDIFMYKLL